MYANCADTVYIVIHDMYEMVSNMMICLDGGDLARLSPQCRDEVLALVSTRLSVSMGNHALPSNSDLEIAGDYAFDWDGPLAVQVDKPVGDRRGGKRVVDISLIEAKALIANISPKSLRTLKLFLNGSPVAIADLIGAGLPYRDLTDLKRSFVGAVTRRLRTVTKNKQAALFLKVPLDGSNKEAIAIRAESVSAIRSAMGLDATEQQGGK